MDIMSIMCEDERRDKFKKLLQTAAYIGIDGHMYKLTVMSTETIKLADNITGETFTMTFDVLADDMHEIELLSLTRTWTPEMMG